MIEVMKICTYNVNSIRTRLELITAWLERRQNDIDVLCIQEIKTVDEKFPFLDFEALGFNCAVYGQKTYNGVALCSKLPFDSVIKKGFSDSSWDEQKRIIHAKIKGIQIVNVYAPHGDVRQSEKFYYKLKWYEKFLRYLSDNCSNSSDLIVLGDMNVTVDDNDVYDARALADTVGTMPEERDALKSIRDFGLTDVYKTLHPDKRQYTWWAYSGGAVWKDEGMRIDHVLAAANIANRINSIEVDMWPRKTRKYKPSDHAPLIASIGDD
ncbi:exodeoxyribonuclease III [Candidatus Magnetoovum chiemensis]|nr:exodeoxyribonuclease III [Candidatus Magnetoovum chiemensis]